VRKIKGNTIDKKERKGDGIDNELVGGGRGRGEKEDVVVVMVVPGDGGGSGCGRAT
jgi:hypothetical protein